MHVHSYTLSHTLYPTHTGGDAIPASINANAVAHPLANGTVVVIGGGIYIAQHWTGPYVRQKRGINFTGVNKQYWVGTMPSHLHLPSH